MSGGPGADFGHLLVERDSPVHRLGADAKIVAVVVFVLAVAVVPQRAWWAFAIDAALVIAVLGAARLPTGTVIRRALVVAPFLGVAALLPIIGEGARASVGPLELSTDGLWAGLNIAANALLGVGASIALTATTPIPALLAGLARLRVPTVIVSIVAFMVRYLDLIVEQFGRMRRAMAARGHDPRWLWQAGPTAAAAGTLFVRCYDRGERIHHAMLARGFTGTMPDLQGMTRTLPRGWAAALAFPATAIIVTITARLA